MPKPLLGPSPVITWIMIACRFLEARFIQFDASLFNILYKKIEYCDKFEFFEYFRVVFFETRPGRKVSMASFGPHQGLDFQFFHVFDDAIAHDLHGRIITGKIGPVGSLPVFRRHGPVLFGYVKNPPPVL